MPTLELTDEQIVSLIEQLPRERQCAVARKLHAERQAWWNRMLVEGEHQIRRVCAERGLDWDAMSEEQRESFVDDWLHEDK